MFFSIQSMDTPELDGMGPWIAKLAMAVAKRRKQEPADVIQDACVIYLKHKHKYDSARGARTSFVWQLLRSRLSPRMAARRKEPRRTEFSQTVLVAPQTFALSDDARRVLFAVTGFESHGTLTPEKVQKRTGWPKKRVAEAMDELRDRWERGQRKQQRVFFEKGEEA